ncbi:chromosome partitioning protein, ParB family [Andreprevotia lacus DSM 23236]|jgi:ParB family chromosome partitioning protein|uniref:Chromosome partitioning protein, ParB family n=1 Tax=Andreprevotia lacus DSM 23236 TaxID=1121001 RepID=A0A1W1XBR4_9NEIS|nr:ParB/RepB/Spo0J family partition protein [Andreprevotia lacus]SMC21224.1 chromosome partitioning protein, ParB family [Andreprevotia lacus DSM 23236]
MVSKKFKGLGRGLDALIGDAGDSLQQLSVDVLQPGRYQPRTHIDQDALAELAESIKAQGLMQPVLVRPLDGVERYEIIAGERRWRASILAGLSEIPALVREVADEAVAAMALIENIQREDLNALEEAQGLQRLIDEFGMTHEAAAQAVGKSRVAVSNLLRLLQLTEPVRDMLMAGQLDMGHARALLPLDMLKQLDAAKTIALKGLSVREAEALVKKLLQGPVQQAEKRVDPDVRRLEEEVSERLGTSVAIKTGKKGAGRISIDYASLDELDRLLMLLK